MNLKYTANTDSIKEMDDFTKLCLDHLEIHLWTRSVNVNRIHEILMNIWEKKLQEKAYQFINSTQENKKANWQSFMKKFNKILKKINNGVYDDDDE